MHRPAVVTLIFLLALAAPALAQEQSDEPPVVSPDDAPQSDLPKRFGIAPYPILMYSPETSLGFGAGVVFTHRPRDGEPDDRPNSLNTLLIYTLKNQIVVNFMPDVYFNDQQGELNIVANYLQMPTGFYGVGNPADLTPDEAEDRYEAFDERSWNIQPWLAHKVWRELRLGLTYDLKQAAFSDLADGRRLDREAVIGHDGGLTSGFGPMIDWDSRDNAFYPSRGGWHKLYARFHHAVFGSRYDFELYALDLRQYVTLIGEHILAMQILGATTTGEVPYYHLPKPQLRGFHMDLFLDRIMAAGQIEYRFPIYWRFSGAAFFGAGESVATMNDFTADNIYYAGGAGVRFAINPDERINVRLDVGVSPYGVAPYLNITEAF